MRRAILFTAAGLLLLGAALWWGQRPSHPQPVEPSIYETDMVEALIRGLLTDLPQPVPPVCFLAFGDGTTTPTAAFLARFTKCRPIVRGCAAAAMPPVGRQFEVSTGQPGLVIHIVESKEITRGSFDVGVRFSNLPKGQDRFAYRVWNIGGRWQIKSRAGA
jgi:hypothetical protein